MTTLNVLNGLNGALRLQEDLERLFEGLPRPARFAGEQGVIHTGEDQDNYYAEAVLPGVAPEAIAVTVEDNVLTIRGNRAAAPEAVRWLQRDRAPGEAVYRLRLSGAVDQSRIAAEYRHGILTLTLPKAEVAKPRAIPVQVQ
jgi:HSP20 family protein